MSDRQIFSWVFYGHFWIALAATCLSLLTLRVTYDDQHCILKAPILLFVFFSTLGIYTLHRCLSFQRAGERPETLRYGIVAHHPRTSLLVGGISVLIAGFLGLMFIEAIWPVLLLALPITIFYLTPPLKGWRRLRDLPYLKNLWVALAWTVVTVVLPVVVIESQAEPFRIAATDDGFDLSSSSYSISPLSYHNFYLELVIRFLFTSCIALLFDLRDVALDRSQGVRTVAGEHPGLHRILVYTGLIICAIAALFQWHFGCVVPGFGAALSAAYLLMVPVAYFTYQKTSEDWFAVVVNGLLLLPPLAYWLGGYLGAGAGAWGGLGL